ncbi:MAG: metalloregulator ArsR/SmtB family transcription factor [Hydrogenothermaceae bacterium]
MENYLQKLFYALSDKTRLKIVKILLDNGEVCVCNLQRVFNTSQPKISFHMRILRDAGIVRGEKRGKWVYYKLNYLPECIESIIRNMPSINLEKNCEVKI